jgi:phosphoribosylformimino-5-aminoimidazole carboxamide ribotide isomerase
MIIYPAIDLKDGKCVRLYQGDMTQDTVYNEDPVAQAKEWAREGFSWLHVVDLNGAVGGSPQNHHAVRDIIKAVDIPIQLGGGIRTHGHIEHWLEEGVSRVILGTAAVRNPQLVREACREFPGQIAVGIDARGGRVSVEGWMHDANIEVIELAKHFEDAGVETIIYTDIARDGTGHGINLEETVGLAKATSIPVIASGGVGSLDDIRGVRAAGLPGIIVGKAFYNKSVEPKAALAVASADFPQAANEA